MIVDLGLVLYRHKIDAARDIDTAVSDTVPLKTKFSRVHELLLMDEDDSPQKIIDPDIDIGPLRNGEVDADRGIERVRIGIGYGELRGQ